MMSTLVQPAPRSVGRQVGRTALDWIPALAVFVLGIGAWQGLVVAFHVQEFLLPKPTSIASAFWTEKHALWSQGATPSAAGSGSPSHSYLRPGGRLPVPSCPMPSRPTPSRSSPSRRS